VFTATATSIKVKLYDDDGDQDTVSCPLHTPTSSSLDVDQDTPQPSGSSTPLDRTSTGIISNKPQKAGLSVLETRAAPKSTELSFVALAKRESARRGLYSRFFRGPTLGPDAEAGEPPVLEVAKRSSQSQARANELACNISTTEKGKGKKRKRREEGEGNTAVMRKKRKSRREDETEGERKEGRLKEGTEKREFYEIRVNAGTETGLMNMSTASEGPVQGDGLGYSRRTDRKKRKRGE
jgi:hypothetical protein